MAIQQVPHELLINRLAVVMDLANKGLVPIIMVCVEPQASFDKDDLVRITLAVTEQLDDREVREILWQILGTKKKVEVVQISL